MKPIRFLKSLYPTIKVQEAFLIGLNSVFFVNVGQYSYSLIRIRIPTTDTDPREPKKTCFHRIRIPPIYVKHRSTFCSKYQILRWAPELSEQLFFASKIPFRKCSCFLMVFFLHNLGYAIFNVFHKYSRSGWPREDNPVTLSLESVCEKEMRHGVAGACAGDQLFFAEILQLIHLVLLCGCQQLTCHLNNTQFFCHFLFIYCGSESFIYRIFTAVVPWAPEKGDPSARELLRRADSTGPVSPTCFDL